MKSNLFLLVQFTEIVKLLHTSSVYGIVRIRIQWQLCIITGAKLYDEKQVLAFSGGDLERDWKGKYTDRIEGFVVSEV